MSGGVLTDMLCTELLDVMAGTGGTVGGIGESVVRLFWLPRRLCAREGRVVPGHGPRFFCTPL